MTHATTLATLGGLLLAAVLGAPVAAQERTDDDLRRDIAQCLYEVKRDTRRFEQRDPGNYGYEAGWRYRDNRIFVEQQVIRCLEGRGWQKR